MEIGRISILRLINSPPSLPLLPSYLSKLKFSPLLFPLFPFQVSLLFSSPLADLRKLKLKSRWFSSILSFPFFFFFYSSRSEIGREIVSTFHGGVSWWISFSINSGYTARILVHFTPPCSHHPPWCATVSFFPPCGTSRERIPWHSCAPTSTSTVRRSIPATRLIFEKENRSKVNEIAVNENIRESFPSNPRVAFSNDSNSEIKNFSRERERDRQEAVAMTDVNGNRVVGRNDNTACKKSFELARKELRSIIGRIEGTASLTDRSLTLLRARRLLGRSSNGARRRLIPSGKHLWILAILALILAQLAWSYGRAANHHKVSNAQIKFKPLCSIFVFNRCYQPSNKSP